MVDWYSAYVMIQARQTELVAAAELRRRLAEARIVSRSRLGRDQKRVCARRGRSLRFRLGAALILLGHSLQGSAAGRQASPGVPL